MRRATVNIGGEPAGVLSEISRRHYHFRYHALYLQNPDAQPVSLTMPTTRPEYEADELFPFFANMVAEGRNRELQARLMRIDLQDLFGLLLATAQYDTIGNVTITPLPNAS